MVFAFTFPGQGSQVVGMGQELAEAFSSARAVFEEVNDALSQNLSDLMWNGPMEDLTMTSNTQPALMAASLAAIRALKSDFDVDIADAKYVAGHSLGEYSALCAAGAISLAQTAKLLRIRGNAMQAAVPVGAGAMAALLGASLEDAENAVAEGAKIGICQIANDNATGQIVLSGVMKPAADAMADALADTVIAEPGVAIVNNVTARPVTDPSQIRADLVAQVTGRVRWRESIEWMAGEGDIPLFAEPGCGKVLTVMLRRIVKGVEGKALNSPEALEAFAEQLKS